MWQRLNPFEFLRNLIASYLAEISRLRCIKNGPNASKILQKCNSNQKIKGVTFKKNCGNATSISPFNFGI
jgi:hypothetical protein